MRERLPSVNGKSSPSVIQVLKLTGFGAGAYDATSAMDRSVKSPSLPSLVDHVEGGGHRVSPGERGPLCPTCRTKVMWGGNANRPFCSLTCRLVDLGVWLDERFRVQSEAADVP